MQLHGDVWNKELRTGLDITSVQSRLIHRAILTPTLCNDILVPSPKYLHPTTAIAFHHKVPCTPNHLQEQDIEYCRLFSLENSLIFSFSLQIASNNYKYKLIALYAHKKANQKATHLVIHFTELQSLGKNRIPIAHLKLMRPNLQQRKKINEYK